MVMPALLEAVLLREVPEKLHEFHQGRRRKRTKVGSDG